MNKKIVIIVGFFISIVILSTLSIIVIKTDDKEEVLVDNNNIEEVNNIEEEDIEEELEEELQEENIIEEEPVKENNNVNNNTNYNSNNNNSNTNNTPKKEEIISTPSNPVVEEPTPTYSCPEGYTLNDKKCIIVTDTHLGCTDGLVSAGDDNISGCISFSEGIYTDDICPDNYISIKMITLDGTPSKMVCYPIHDKVPVCYEGYTLVDNKCYAEIDATLN